jgi:hypothetical protein
MRPPKELHNKDELHRLRTWNAGEFLSSGFLMNGEWRVAIKGRN